MENVRWAVSWRGEVNGMDALPRKAGGIGEEGVGGVDMAWALWEQAAVEQSRWSLKEPWFALSPLDKRNYRVSAFTESQEAQVRFMALMICLSVVCVSFYSLLATVIYVFSSSWFLFFTYSVPFTVISFFLPLIISSLLSIRQWMDGKKHCDRKYLVATRKMRIKPRLQRIVTFTTCA